MIGRRGIPARTLRFALAASLLAVVAAACATPPPMATPSAEPTVTVRPTSTAVPLATPMATAAARPTDTPPPSPTATSTAAPPLTWEGLKNSEYPSEFPKDGVARLVDGVYREKYMPDSATEMVISLADIQTYGDLNGDGIDDALVILVSHPGGSGTFFDLAAVLNEGGAPKPVATASLGDRVIIRSMTIEAGRIVLQMIIQGPDDPMCCPNTDRRQVLVLQDGALATVEQEDTPRTEPAIPPTVELERIALAPGATAATFQGSIPPIGDKRYVVHGYAKHTLSLAVTSPYDHVLLSCYGSDGAVLVSILDETTSWTGELPRTLDYIVTLVSTAGDETAFALQVELTGQPAATPEPTATPEPVAAQEKIIYLTFDDGPVDPQWTPQVLEVLAGYGARATFFVLGQLAERFPDLIRAEADAGHTVANHTLDHRTLDGVGREAFFKQIEDAQEALGEWGAKCLRPPYGAMDAYTRTYAAELGYTIVMWTIDTQDWKRPGTEVIASRVLEEVRPGSIVLMHDGGGDRAQTVEALKAVLETLSKQGFKFEVACR